MKTLKVTGDWLFWFHSEKIEIVSTIDNREILTTNIIPPLFRTAIIQI